MPRLLPQTLASSSLARSIEAASRKPTSRKPTSRKPTSRKPTSRTPTSRKPNRSRGGLLGGVAGCLLALTSLLGATACTNAPADAGSESEAEPAADSLERTLRDNATKTAMCVQPDRYAVTDELVIDRNEGGKTWQRKVQPDVLTHDDAASFCASLKVGGRGEFRLPTATELQGLLVKPGLLHAGDEYCSPAIDQVAFPETPADWFWSSDVRSQGDALYTGFADGRTHAADPTERLFVRCLRD